MVEVRFLNLTILCDLQLHYYNLSFYHTMTLPPIGLKLLGSNLMQSTVVLAREQNTFVKMIVYHFVFLYKG